MEKKIAKEPQTVKEYKEEARFFPGGKLDKSVIEDEEKTKESTKEVAKYVMKKRKGKL